MAKKVVYLFGAGATQAVIQDIDPENSLMTSDVQKHILKNYSNRGIDDRIWNELVTEGNDIEHLISVLETQYNYSTSEKIRRYYQEALVNLSKKFSKKPEPNLYTVLSDLHLNIFSNLPKEKAGLEEELLCFITLNYEDILEKSIKKHFKYKYKIDYAIETTTPVSNGNKLIVIKLHGSFNWTNRIPIQIKSMGALKSGNALWIPPGVEKRKENYPFNLLWGKTMEYLMRCDVLRIVGCSLSRNDWGLIPILYTVQRFNDKKKIEIEIIDYLDTGEDIEKNYTYLKIKKITEINELIFYYKRKFPHSNFDERQKEMKTIFIDKDKTNPFQIWLDAKIETLIEQKIDIPKTCFVHNFYYKT